MALLACYECGKEVSTRAVSCPHCGAPVNGRHGSPHGAEASDIDPAQIQSHTRAQSLEPHQSYPKEDATPLAEKRQSPVNVGKIILGFSAIIFLVAVGISAKKTQQPPINAISEAFTLVNTEGTTVSCPPTNSESLDSCVRNAERQGFVKLSNAVAGISVDWNSKPLRIFDVKGTAMEAGLRNGDVLVQIDGTKMVESSSVLRIMANKQPRDQITVKIIRTGRSMQFTYKAMQRPGTAPANSTVAQGGTYTTIIGLMSLIVMAVALWGFITGKVAMTKIRVTRKGAAIALTAGLALFCLAAAIAPRRPARSAQETGKAKVPKSPATSEQQMDEAKPITQAVMPIQTAVQTPNAEQPASRAPIREEPRIPNDQNEFTRIVLTYKGQYAAGANELQKSLARKERKATLHGFLTDLEINSWKGKLVSMGTNSDGKAYISVEVGPGIYLKTWNNALSDISSKTLIEPDAAIYGFLATLRTGQYIQFSGNFLPDDKDYIRESSLTEGGSMTRPEFIFRFTDLSR